MLKEIFKQYQNTNDPYGFISMSGLEWFCNRTRESEDGSKMYIMETTDDKYGFTFGEYNGKCEYMYNLHTL